MARPITPIDFNKHYQVGTNEEFIITKELDSVPEDNGRLTRYVNIQFVNPNSLGFITTKIIKLRYITGGYIIHDPYVFNLPLNSSTKIACFGDPDDPILVSYANYKLQYNIWSAIIDACYNPTVKTYRSHGGQGVRVCLNWRVFTLFLHEINQLPNYDQWMLDPKEWVLDIIKPYNIGDPIEYNLENCAFVPKHTIVFKSRHARGTKNNYYGICRSSDTLNNYYVKFKHPNGKIQITYDNEIAAAAMFNYIVKLNGYTDDKLNQLPREVSLTEIRNASIKPKWVNALHRQLYHRLAFYNDDVDARAEKFIREHCKPTQYTCI